MERKVVLFGAGEYGKKALELIGKDNISFFVDNALEIKGSFVDDIIIKNYGEEKQRLNEYDIVISVSTRYYGEIEKTLKNDHILNFYSVEQYLKKKKYCIGKWEQYKNLYKGKRCFVLGTGPSLLVKDLERLHEKNEVCFGANKIFKIFEQTTWRPNLYCATDRRILDFYQDVIANLSLENMFIAYYSESKLQTLYDRFLGVKYINLFTMRNSINEEKIEFSEEPSEYVVEGRTVIYAMIQLAVYMGFDEIYLLGVDFNYSDTTGYDKNGNDHFCKDYIEKGEEVLISPKEYCLKAFQKAEEYTKKHGIKIFNATRGGKLEVFERIDIDKVLRGDI